MQTQILQTQGITANSRIHDFCTFAPLSWVGMDLYNITLFKDLFQRYLAGKSVGVHTPASVTQEIGG